MNSTTGPTDPKKHEPIPVDCHLCGTRMYAGAGQEGKTVACPDCHSSNVVKKRSKPKRVNRIKATGDEYQLRAEEKVRRAPQKRASSKNVVAINCSVCDTLLRAKREHVGKKVRCPECKSLTVISAPKEAPKFNVPDASDVQLDKAPTPKADEKKKEIADRLMAQAEEYVDKKEAEKPIPPKAPLRESIYSFPFYPKVLPLWIGLGAAILLNLAILDVIVDMMAAGGAGSILVAFLVPMVSLGVLVTAGLAAPHLLSVIEFTSQGHNDIPFWPTQDLLSRGRAVLFWVNSLAMATAPSVFAISLIRKTGVGLPMICAILPVAVLLPWIVLSMLDNDSIFVPYSKTVFRNVAPMSRKWMLFYLHVLGGAAAIILIDQIIYQFAPEATRYVTVFGLCIFAIVFARLIGRMAWILGEHTAR